MFLASGSAGRRSRWNAGVVASIAGLVLGGCAASSPRANAPPRVLTLQEVGERVSPLVVQVTTEQGGGSGLVVRDDGWIVTSYQVVEGAHDVHVVFRDGRSGLADLVRIAPEVGDLVLVHVPMTGLGAAELGDSAEAKPGVRVIAIGSPRGLARTLSESVYNGRRRVNGRQFLQFSVPVSSGAAGGPVLDEHGTVIGLMSNDRPGDRPLDLAVPVEDLKTLLASSGVPRQIAELGARAGEGCTRFGMLQCAANCWDGHDGLSCIALAHEQEERAPGPAYEAASRACQLGARGGCTTAATFAMRHHATNRPLLSEIVDALLEACRKGEREACAMVAPMAKLADRPIAASARIDYLDKACTGEIKSACDELARAYAVGDAVKKSRKRAAEYRRRAKVIVAAGSASNETQAHQR